MIKCIAFDCFGTVFDMSGIDRSEIRTYVNHVKRNDFSPYKFPASWYAIPAHPDAKEGIDALRAAGYQCVTLSNGSADLLTYVSAMADLEWNWIIDLAKYRVYKPNVDAYRTVKKETGFHPDECLMVTANPTFGDLEGATAIGMPSKVIRQPGELADINALAQWLKETR